ALRRPRDHGSPGRDPSLRGGRLLARVLGPDGVVEEECLVHSPYMLGRPGGALLPLRHQEVPAPGEVVRAFPPPGARPEGPSAARLRRGLPGAALPPHRGAPRGYRGRARAKASLDVGGGGRLYIRVAGRTRGIR